MTSQTSFLWSIAGKARVLSQATKIGSIQSTMSWVRDSDDKYNLHHMLKQVNENHGRHREFLWKFKFYNPCACKKNMYGVSEVCSLRNVWEFHFWHILQIWVKSPFSCPSFWVDASFHPHLLSLKYLYSLLFKVPSDLFAISSTGWLTLENDLDFEVAQEYFITVIAKVIQIHLFTEVETSQ